MKPIGPLMWEHRLIERLMDALKTQIHKIRAELTINGVLIDTAVDFIHTYADRTHHGKEEDILFRDLSKQPLSSEHRRIMQELVEEHAQARRMTQGLVEAKERFFHGDAKAIKEVERYFCSFFKRQPGIFCQYHVGKIFFGFVGKKVASFK